MLIQSKLKSYTLIKHVTDPFSIGSLILVVMTLVMGLASCASKGLPFSKATTMMRKLPGGLLLKMASTARAISCNLIPPLESTATSNVRGGREKKHTLDAGP